MEKTIYGMILDKLNLEPKEKFNIIAPKFPSYRVRNPYYFKKGILFDNSNTPCYPEFVDLITSKATIEKLFWKPKDGGLVWFVNFDGTLSSKNFQKNKICELMFDKGWVFKTKEEAAENAEQILKEMEEMLENEIQSY